MRLERNGEKINLPDFMIVGAAKSGTSTLYHLLDQHKDIYFPASKKEPHYFSFNAKPPVYQDAQFSSKMIWKSEDYFELYRKAGEDQLLGDGSTSYLYNAEKVIHHIKQVYGESNYPKVKIVIILRNPIERAFSHYNYLLRNGFEDLSFTKAIEPIVIEERKKLRWGFDYLKYGEYDESVKLYQQNFESVKVFLFEELKTPEKLNHELCSFLEMEEKSITELPKTNPSGRSKNETVSKLLIKNKGLKKMVNWLPANTKRSILMQRDKLLKSVLVKDVLEKETQKQLKEYYKESIWKLQDHITQDLSTWLT